MNQSEFWNALEQVYGPVLGRSLVQDLYLVPVGATAAEALERGVDAEVVWDALVTETGRGEEARWAHRQPKRRG